MRLVVKNKDEGTELFKGGNIRPAAARYQKALSHAGMNLWSINLIL
jgi:heat shock protein 4